MPDGKTNYWPRYSRRCRMQKVHLAGFPGGRVGRVSVYRRDGAIALRWRQDGCRKWEPVGNAKDEDTMALAVSRASEINREIADRVPATASFRKIAVREACETYMDTKESTPGVCGATIRRYSAQLARIVAFSERTGEGRRARFLHEIDTRWVEAFCRWVETIETRRAGRARRCF